MRWLSLSVLLMPWVFHTAQADWPQWRHDAQRSGATPAEGPTAADVAWQLNPHRPDPAYDHQYRMCADETYAPVAAEGLLFVPSNVTDSVTAYDLETGIVRWRFAAAGPVRFAPAYAEGTLCVAADDGFLYGLEARDGTVKWRVRGVPDHLPGALMLVNGRLCSRWPVRGAPVVHDGVVYVGAGIWPEEGAYVSAVRVRDGTLLWRTDALSLVSKGMSDHGRAYDLSLPPQGYLGVVDGKLAVPSGRALAAWFDPASGEMEPYTSFYVKTSPPRGTWYVAGTGRFCVQGGNWFGTRADAVQAPPDDLEDATSALFWSRERPDNETWVLENRPFLRADTYRLHNENLYTEPVLTDETAYMSEFADDAKYLVPRGHTHVSHPPRDRIVARDLRRPRWTTVMQPHVAHGRKRVPMLRLDFPLLWELESPLRVLAKAGTQLVAGGENTIAAIRIPGEGGDPAVAWQAELDGTPVNALVSDGFLVVATDRGQITCFGKSMPRPGRAADVPREHLVPEAGYALAVGWGDGAVPRGLAGPRTHRVVVLEQDAETVAQARQHLLDDELNGHWIHVVRGSLATTPLTPYWVDHMYLAPGPSIGSFQALDTAFELLRPHTGLLQAPVRPQMRNGLRRVAAATSGFEFSETGGGLWVRRTGAPLGADDWTHESGGPDNRFANSEDAVRWPLAVLWYSGGIDRHFTPASHFQHERHPYPLVKDGRMFLMTGERLHAVDIYTGRYLWGRDMPMTPYLHGRCFDSRIYGRPTERNGVVAEDWLYCVVGDAIAAYDVTNGEPVARFEIPDALKAEATDDRHGVVTKRFQGHEGEIQGIPQWTEVRLWNDLLIAFIGRHLVALDRHSGAVRWSRPTSRDLTTYAIGNDTLFGIDCDEPELGGGGELGDAVLFALDPRDASVRWERPAAYPGVPKHTVDQARPWLRPVIPELACNTKHDLLVLTVNRKQVHAFRGRDGTPVWSREAAVAGNLQQVYPPAVTDDYLLLSQHNGCYGFLLDLKTGKELGANSGIPRPRTCARILGNNHLLVYRDAATELYDISANRMIGINSMRSGCTTSFIPAGGVMAAPMLGHGCVCNYPMFASVGLYHDPGADAVRPEAVRSSWVNQAAAQMAAQPVNPFDRGGPPADPSPYRLDNATLAARGSAFQFSVDGDGSGSALRALDAPLAAGTISLQAQRVPTPGRHGNIFLVLATGPERGDRVQCGLYYGGRGSIAITGPLVEDKEVKITRPKRNLYLLRATVDCREGTLTLKSAGGTLTTRFAVPVTAITHVGYGGGNSDNLVTPIAVQRSR